ncbi:hypothetical protein MHYP_G00266150 [Metynnis hypsauchen]
MTAMLRVEECSPGAAGTFSVITAVPAPSKPSETVIPIQNGDDSDPQAETYSEIASTAAPLEPPDMEDANAQSLASAQCPGSTASGELTTTMLKEVLITTIREEISTLRAEFIAELRSSHANLTTSINSLNSKVRDMETAATDMDKRIADLETTCKTLDSENKRLREKMDDLENRSRRNNLRIIGIPEGAEGSQPTLFMGSFFTELFGASKLPNPPEIDRAHRAPIPRPQPGARPRPMLVRFLRFQAKEEILRLSRQQGQSLYKNSRVHIFPDLSVELRNRRNKFKSVKLKLHEAGLKFRMQYPARLIFSFDGSTHKFDSAAEACSFLNATVLPTPRAVPDTAAELKI